MAIGDSVIVNCPHCGKASSYTLRGNDLGQVDTCRHCSKDFYIYTSGGRVREVRE